MAHAISPELVLVDPDLARAERARLVESGRLAVVLGNAELSSARRLAEPRADSWESPLPRPRSRDVVLVAVVGLSLAANGALAAVLLTRNAGDAVPAARRTALTAAEALPADTETSPLGQPRVTGPAGGQVPRRLLRWIQRAPSAALPRNLLDRATGRASNDLRTVCRATAQRSVYRCAVWVPGRRDVAQVVVRYPAPAEGGALVKWLP